MTHISTLNDLEVQTVEAKPTQDIPKKTGYTRHMDSQD